MTQSHLARIRKKILSNPHSNSGGRPQVLKNVPKRVCVKNDTLGGIDVATKVAQHVRYGIKIYCKC